MTAFTLLALFIVAHLEPLTIRVTPTIMLRRTNIQVEARVRPDAANRILALAWTSDLGSEGSTQHQLAGEDAEILHVWTFRDQPAANYAFVAALFDAQGKRRTVVTAEVHTPDGAR